MSPNNEEARPDRASLDVLVLSQRNYVFLHKVLKRVQAKMHEEVGPAGGKTRGWMMANYIACLPYMESPSSLYRLIVED
jgi:hypothetical protein